MYFRLYNIVHHVFFVDISLKENSCSYVLLYALEVKILKKKVLIIDDDLSVCREIKYSLQSETTEVYYALSVKEGFELFTKEHFCLVIMDIILSETDGVVLLQTIRLTKPVPILVLSSKADTKDKVSALKAGANVYLNKPYELEECLAHAQSLMKLYSDLQTAESRSYTLAFGMDLIIDPVRHQATLKGEPLNLTRKEFGLLFTLASHAGQVLSREQLYSFVWNDNIGYNVDELIKTHIKTLRRKLTPAGAEYIKNVWGVGYQFSPED